MENLDKFRSRAEGWSLNDDAAWVKVKLGEIRSALKEVDRLNKEVQRLKQEVASAPRSYHDNHL